MENLALVLVLLAIIAASAPAQDAAADTVTPFEVTSPVYDPATGLGYSARNAMDVTGNVEAGSRVTLSVNDAASPRVITAANTAEGRFTFQNVALSGRRNRLRLTATDGSGADAEISFEI
ncbi:hypothetical protein HYX09_00770, partial [Candidatus Woesearchaeota archaeon]|nr:hypothetical protein [Candidatus Woesearchaeota archaeon]